MLVYDSARYRIEYLPSINRGCPYALDFKEMRNGRISLVNLGWFETETIAHRNKNNHAGHYHAPSSKC